MLVPAELERRLLELDVALDDAHEDLVRCEAVYQESKADYELLMARTRIDLLNVCKMTVQERDDRALSVNGDVFRALMTAEALVKASRANVSRLRMKVDIARSLNAGMRASMTI